MTATAAAYSTFRFTLANPGEVALNDAYSNRINQYALGWNAYTNRAFSALAAWGSYASANGLYPKTRGFYNPTTRLVDFYVGHVYQGVLSETGANLPDGEMLAIPLLASPEVKAANAQLWQWGNWQQNKDLMVMFGASMGDVFIEAVEDVQKGRVWPQVIPPGHIKEVEFDGRGNVIFYDKQYGYYDRKDKRAHTYRKVVDKEIIREYRDDVMVSETENGYGFVPLVYVGHRSFGVGSLPGAPAIRSWGKVENLNSLATRLYRYLEVQSQSPQVIFGDGELDVATLDSTKKSDNDLKLLRFRGNGSIHNLSGNLDVAASEKRVESLLHEVENDHPEIVMYEKLRAMGDVSGVAVERLMGDVRGHVQRARAGYDAGMIRTFQMLISIGGMRAQERRDGWRDLSEGQKKFLPFDLGSYDRGDLDFSIAARPLVPVSSLERWTAKQAQFATYRAGIDVGVPLAFQMEKEGVSDEELQELEDAQEVARQAEMVEL